MHLIILRVRERETLNRNRHLGGCGEGWKVSVLFRNDPSGPQEAPPPLATAAVQHSASTAASAVESNSCQIPITRVSTETNHLLDKMWPRFCWRRAQKANADPWVYTRPKGEPAPLGTSQAFILPGILISLLEDSNKREGERGRQGTICHLSYGPASLQNTLGEISLQHLTHGAEG